eukprot:1159864-Pelagomonas_calceolata.AAC.3
MGARAHGLQATAPVPAAHGSRAVQVCCAVGSVRVLCWSAVSVCEGEVCLPPEIPAARGGWSEQVWSTGLLSWCAALARG